MSDTTKETWTESRAVENKVFDAMEHYGGSFVQALAAAWRHADSSNSQKLHIAFGEYFEEYRQMAQAIADCDPSGK